VDDVPYYAISAFTQYIIDSMPTIYMQRSAIKRDKENHKSRTNYRHYLRRIR